MSSSLIYTGNKIEKKEAETIYHTLKSWNYTGIIIWNGIQSYLKEFWNIIPKTQKVNITDFSEETGIVSFHKIKLIAVMESLLNWEF